MRIGCRWVIRLLYDRILNCKIRKNKMMEYLNLATALVAFCSAICALTPTPKDDAIIAKVYKLLELFAFNIGKAKE